MSSSRFKGSLTALVTPFRNGVLDEGALRELVDWQIESGTHGLVPAGTTGESPTLTHDEHKRLVELCVGEARGRVPVVAGAGSNNTVEAVDFARHAERSGADGDPPGHALLQQAEPGGPVPALQGGKRRHRPADHHLQHSAPVGRRHERSTP